MRELEKNINIPYITTECNPNINVNTRNKLEKLSARIQQHPNSPTIVSENKEWEKVIAR